MSEGNNEQNSLENSDESITQVGGGGKKPVPNWVFYGFLGFMVVLASFVVIGGMGGDDKKAEKDGVNFTEERYEFEGGPVPMDQRNDEAPQFTIQTDDKPVLPDNFNQNAGLTPEQKQKLRQEAELRQRRKHSPVVIINNGISTTTQENVSTSDLRQQAADQMARLESQTLSALESMNSNGDSHNDGSLSALETPDVELVHAGMMQDRSFKIAQGKMIKCVLETAINSDLPGMTRCIVSEPVYSEDGRTLIVEPGSRIVGEYRSGLERGQVRVFVVWSRLILPDGIDIKIDSPGTDQIGQSGMTGWVDRHFLERFGASALLSMISGYAQEQADNDNQVVALSDSFAKSSEVALEDSINISPTVHINQGETVNVFVAKDLNFKQAMLYRQRQLKFK